MRVAVIGLPSFACLIAAFLGCGGEDSSGAPTKGHPEFSNADYAVPIAGCEGASYEACDITQAGCQKAMFDLVKCVRHTADGRTVPIREITASAYRERLQQGIAAEAADANTSSTADVTTVETALHFFGLASPGDLSLKSQVEALVSSTLAYYSNETKSITVITADSTIDRRELTDVERSLTLAHEMVHALQDQERDLSAFPRATVTVDQELAWRSAVEGEATLYQAMLSVAFAGVDQSTVNFPLHFMNVAKLAFEKDTKRSPYLDAPQVFPYTYGARLAYHLFKVGGHAEIDGWYSNQFGDTLTYIASVDGIVNPKPIPVTASAPTHVAGGKLLYEDTLGAWLVYEMFRSLPDSTHDPDSVVSGWLGDRLWVYGATDSPDVVAIWRTTWDSASAASAFVTKARSVSAMVTGAVSDGFVVNNDGVVVVSSGAAALSSWVAAAKAPAAQAGADGGAPVPADKDGTSEPALPTKAPALRTPRWVGQVPRDRR